jgi:hypothetical protein
MKCYKIKHKPSNKFLSKNKNPVSYDLSDRGTTWKVKINLSIFDKFFNINDLEYYEV